MTTPHKNFAKLKEDLNSTYKNLAQSQNSVINFDDNLINNYFIWNQNIVDLEISSNSQSLQLKGFKPKIDENNFSENLILLKMRPSIDLSLCYRLFHNPQIHHELRQQINSHNNFKIDPLKIFDDFEKARLLCIVKNFYLGIALNLLNKIEQDISSVSSSNLDLILIGEIYRQQILPQTKIFIDCLANNLNQKIYQNILNLVDHLDDQKTFSNLVKSIIDELLFDDQNSNTNSANSRQLDDDKKSPDEQNFGAETTEHEQLVLNQEAEETQAQSQDISKERGIEVENLDQLNLSSSKINDESEDKSKIEFVNSYQIYSSQFDEIIYPKNFISKSELEALRKQLDLKISKLNSISKKISLRLKRKLLSKKNNYFDIDASYGVLNRKRYADLVISPMIEDIWINIRNHEYNDTALTILLDNSGSMRGNPIVMSTLACQIIAEILEKFSIKTEIIGFTTSDWRGGRVRKLWEMAGRKKNPGRLNELRHIIYKSFNQSFKKAKVNLGLMLKEGILKENIDGEALLFARSRLMQQTQKRKILMVISDGTPVDDSTASANDSDILTQHLRHVINIIEKQGKIEIIGVGIGHATDDFYKNSITIKSLDELGDVMIDKIINVL
ncbi:MAG: hypothetical protein FJX30_02835 [Alphaproteobacteria bacterium]|nr:hypothetical protein [Alphaproteobacteria bacterium]